jgi:NhaB family Na+:H+ antiporter
VTKTPRRDDAVPQASWGGTIFRVFLGHAPPWYKVALLLVLAINPLVLAAFGPFVAGWLVLLEFIGALALALKCYPLQPAGLLALEAVLIGLTTPEHVAQEVDANFSVILLLMFMVAGIYFLRDLLLFVFTGLLVRIRSKTVLSLVFCAVSALLSAFLDALTVVAVVVTVALGFYGLYHRVASGRGEQDDHDPDNDAEVDAARCDELARFRRFLQSLVMHAAVGTALGGACTLVGEPQNLVIGEAAGWGFIEFAVRMSPVTIPVLLVGLVTCFLVERFGLFGYGEPLPAPVRQIIAEHAANQRRHRTRAQWVRLGAQALAAAFLVIGLMLHLAEV